jgi:hypothetical protein
MDRPLRLVHAVRKATPGPRRPGGSRPRCRHPVGFGSQSRPDELTRGRTSLAIKRANPAMSGSSPVGWNTTVSAPACAHSSTARANSKASPAMPTLSPGLSPHCWYWRIEAPARTRADGGEQVGH